MEYALELKLAAHWAADGRIRRLMTTPTLAK